jgi:hypothetical protein
MREMSLMKRGLMRMKIGGWFGFAPGGSAG